MGGGGGCLNSRAITKLSDDPNDDTDIPVDGGSAISNRCVLEEVDGREVVDNYVYSL